MIKKENNYAFIDGANLHKGIQGLGWKLDYKRFRVFLAEKYAVKRAYLFVGLRPELSTLYRDLQSWGFVLIFKPTVIHEGRIKGNCDAELVLQAMIDFDDYEKAVIVSGDGDFACLIKHLDNYEKLEKVICPDHKRCSALIKRSIPPNKLVFLSQHKKKLELRGK